MAGGEHGLLEIIMATHAGMTTDAFSQIVLDWLATAKHPTTGRLYREMVYQPMLELLAYLRGKHKRIIYEHHGQRLSVAITTSSGKAPVAGSILCQWRVSIRRSQSQTKTVLGGKNEKNSYQRLGGGSCFDNGILRHATEKGRKRDEATHQLRHGGRRLARP
jgi:hypothetical protein